MVAPAPRIFATALACWLAGFCAATYQRGVGYVQVPTTLVAQVDSAYGGKTGVDLAEAKNYVGAYHQPTAVLADTALLGLLALSTTVAFGLSGLTLLIFARAGLRSALPLAHSAGSRNTGLMLAAAAGAVPELVWLYVALAQFPIYVLPLAFKPLVRLLTRRNNPAR